MEAETEIEIKLVSKVHFTNFVIGGLPNTADTTFDLVAHVEVKRVTYVDKQITFLNP